MRLNLNNIKIFSCVLVMLFAVSQKSRAQELNCIVQVLAPQLQSNPANQDIINSLQEVVFEFMNNTKWTGDVFKVEERIDCSVIITISERNSDDFKANIQVQSFRTAFNSSYRSPVFNYLDRDFEFRYLRNTAVIFNPTRHGDNLAAVLAYYAYIILGFDYDTYSPEGGTIYFQKAQDIVSNAQGAPERGWKSNEDTRNRFWLVDNALQNIFEPIRKFMYDFHRKGLDMLYDKRDEAMVVMVESLELLKDVHKIRPGSMNMQVLFLSKSQEFISVFKEGYPEQKAKAYNILKEVDAPNANKYQQIIR
jgi:hypothetical protein